MKTEEEEVEGKKISSVNLRDKKKKVENRSEHDCEEGFY